MSIDRVENLAVGTSGRRVVLPKDTVLALVRVVRAALLLFDPTKEMTDALEPLRKTGA